MSDEESTDPQSNIYHRSVRPKRSTETEQLLSVIADVEDCDVTELPPIYNRIGDMLNDLFGEPPVEGSV